MIINLFSLTATLLAFPRENSVALLPHSPENDIIDAYVLLTKAYERHRRKQKKKILQLAIKDSLTYKEKWTGVKTLKRKY